MDLNYLYQRHQISLVKAQRATCAASRRAHQELVDAYAGMIAEAKNHALSRAA